MKYIKYLFTPTAMGALFVVFAVAMAAATFIENDYGASAAYKSVYGTTWFELILLLLCVNLIGQLVINRLFRKSKLPTAVFHLAFILMIAGAAITRYFGWEGMMHIREGDEQNICYLSYKSIGYDLKDNTGTTVSSLLKKYNMSSVSADEFKTPVNIGSSRYSLELSRIIPNAEETITPDVNGGPVVSLTVTADMVTNETVTLRSGETKSAMGITIGLDAPEADVNIKCEHGNFIAAANGLHAVNMMQGMHNVPQPASDSIILLMPMQVLTFGGGGVKIVPQVMEAKGSIKAVAVNPRERTTGKQAFIFNIFNDSNSQTVILWDLGSEESMAESSCTIDGATLTVKYGAEAVNLPFSIKLNDFILERYPGSSSPSSFKSDVTLVDRAAGEEKQFLIFMNNILKYKGYRFYQSSYDHDEQGTILSVNHDVAGMVVTYTGYALLMIFIVLALLNRKSLFHTIGAGSWKSSLRKTLPLLLFLIISGLSDADAQKLVPDKRAAEDFGNILVQDQKGRTKPIFTLSADILRKVTRENNFEGMTPMQVFLGLSFDFTTWQNHPLIRVSNDDLKKKLGITGTHAAFSDIVDLHTGQYKISDDVNMAYEKAPGARDRLDKELMKVDERVNIVYMIYNGAFLKMFPLKNGTSDWGLWDEALEGAINGNDSTYLNEVIPALTEAFQNNNAATVKQVTRTISEYQKRFSAYELPSDTKTKFELFYYKLNVFEKLFPFYATIGLVMLLALIMMVIRNRKGSSPLVKALTSTLFAGYLLHTFGLGLRWYISGHSPMSNGYESMIFISWVTLMAGFIFRRRSEFALPATASLAAMTLMVAHLSFMDPEITNLVPVLKSYWLTLHVSIITGSYGFLGLGAILGLISMILMILCNKHNRERISDTIDELTVINYKAIVLGLYFLTIGTFLGAIWANESWGRYWGWDPKETWSLITIIVYSMVVHSRSIPGMKDIFIYNLLALFAFSSVLMTYFGVNYYLSGLHSYAAGDPVPVPAFVYITVILLIALSAAAYYKYRMSGKKG
ncbi:MAG: c-type cytochrome biogenesis protein CcsB [Bacteroidales bacterium]|jgi:cytochrome c-type biogenesis protein CcsB|nr:c-type cytochrome biogenesis protein CcsB [Bacteroidales bacterium]